MKTLLTNTSRNQSPYLFAFSMLAVIGAIMLLPIEGLLSNMPLSDFQTEYIEVTTKFGVLFIISLVGIKLLKIEVLAGLSSQYLWTNKLLNCIPVYLFVIGIFSVVSQDLSQIQLSNVLLLLIACLAVGFAEEFMFRGLLQSLLIKKYISYQNGVFISVIIPAMFFGLFHLINLVKSDQVLPIVIQVIYATFIGFFFGVLVLRTNKLIPVAVTHGLVNFFFSLQMLPSIKVDENEVIDPSLSEQLGASVGPLILFLPLFIIALFLIKKVKKENVSEKLQGSFTWLNQ